MGMGGHLSIGSDYLIMSLYSYMYNMKSYRSRLFVHLFASDPVDLTYYEFVNHIDLSENTQFDWMKKKKSNIDFGLTSRPWGILKVQISLRMRAMTADIRLKAIDEIYSVVSKTS